MTAKRGPHRGKQRAHDLAVVERMYLEGRPIRAIAERLAVTAAQVDYDIRVIGRAWRASTLVDFDEQRRRETAKIDNLEREAWDAWYRSQRDQEETTTERREGRQTEAMARTRRRVGMSGDAQFLGVVQWCINRRIQLLGLDAPQRVTIEAVRAEAERFAEATGFSVDEIMQDAADVVRLANQQKYLTP